MPPSCFAASSTDNSLSMCRVLQITFSNRQALQASANVTYESARKASVTIHEAPRKDEEAYRHILRFRLAQWSDFQRAEARGEADRIGKGCGFIEQKPEEAGCSTLCPVE